MKKKIEITLVDIKEVWYIMECPCDFEEFVQSYVEDKDYKVINDWKITIYSDTDSFYF